MGSARSQPSERRKRERQQSVLPLEIVTMDGVPVPHTPESTLNISSGGGVCFHSGRTMPVGSKVEYVVTLSPGNAPVKINCVGRVLRCVNLATGKKTAVNEIALSMDTYRFAASQ